MFIGNAKHSEKISAAAVEAFKKSVQAELESRLDVKRNLMERLVAVRAPQDGPLKADSAGSALKELEPLLEQERSRFRSVRGLLKPKGITPFSITTNGGLVVAVPPYDLEWTSSFPVSIADKNAGAFRANSYLSDSFDALGYHAAGLGIFIDTNSSMDVRFSADAQFDWNWSDVGGVDENRAAATEGGVGVLVYEGGNVITRNDALLWSDFQSGEHYAAGDDSTFLTQTVAGQTYFHMEPGRQYQVWVWCWVTASLQGTGLPSETINANMPFVVVEQQS